MRDDSSAQAPVVKVDDPAKFRRSLAVNHFHRSQDVLHIDWNPIGAQDPMTLYACDWPAQLKSEDDNHHWTIDVYGRRNPKVATTYARAKDGYEADLDEFVDFLIPPSSPPPGYFKPPRALAYFFARFKRKHFAWGNAVSFLRQGVQDTSMPTPENGHLFYEIWGETKDRRHTVVARVAVGRANSSKNILNANHNFRSKSDATSLSLGHRVMDGALLFSHVIFGIGWPAPGKPEQTARSSITLRSVSSLG